MTNFIKTLASLLARPLRQSAMRRELIALDDRMLADIGLRRDQIAGLCDHAFVADRTLSVSGTSADLFWLTPRRGHGNRDHRLAA